jgi:hypothetical protein
VPMILRMLAICGLCLVPFNPDESLSGYSYDNISNVRNISDVSVCLSRTLHRF